MPPTDSNCTCFYVRRAARHLSQAYDRHLAPSGLRTTQFSMLAMLDAQGPRSQSALARAMGMDRTTLGRNLRPLERDGLISRQVDGADRRGRALSVTPKGQNAIASARSLWRQAQDQFETAYGAAATASLHRTLADLSALDLA